MIQLTSIEEFQNHIVKEYPIVMVFTSSYCHSCTVFEAMLAEVIHDFASSIMFLKLGRGTVEGLEKAFHLVQTPMLVTVTREKRISKYHCFQMKKEELYKLLEELHETNC